MTVIHLNFIDIEFKGILKLFSRRASHDAFLSVPAIT